MGRRALPRRVSRGCGRAALCGGTAVPRCSGASCPLGAGPFHVPDAACIRGRVCDARNVAMVQGTRKWLSARQPHSAQLGVGLRCKVSSSAAFPCTWCSDAKQLEQSVNPAMCATWRPGDRRLTGQFTRTTLQSVAVERTGLCTSLTGPADGALLVCTPARQAPASICEALNRHRTGRALRPTPSWCGRAGYVQGLGQGDGDGRTRCKQACFGRKPRR